MELTKEQEDIIERVHNFVKSESEKSPTHDDFDYHVYNVVRLSKILADKYNANKFVVVVAAYLHDIACVQNPNNENHETHEVEGSKFAKNYLSQFSIPPEEIDLICSCILNHRQGKEDNSNKKSVEEKIIASADAMDHIDRCLTMFFRTENKNIEEAIKISQEKIKKSWNKIELDKAKEIINPKYEAAKILFDIE